MGISDLSIKTPLFLQYTLLKLFPASMIELVNSQPAIDC